LHARPEVACRCWAGRVALRETARVNIIPQVRDKVNTRPRRGMLGSDEQMFGEK
jgi:hypothetical protein